MLDNVDEEARENYYPDEIHSLEKRSPEEAHQPEEYGGEQENAEFEETNKEEAEETGIDQGREEVPFMDENIVAKEEEEEVTDSHKGDDEVLQEMGTEEAKEEEEEERAEMPMISANVENEDMMAVAAAESPIGGSLNAEESDQIRQFSHPDLDRETGPAESVRSLASSSMEGGTEQQSQEKQEETEGPAQMSQQEDAEKEEEGMVEDSEERNEKEMADSEPRMDEAGEAYVEEIEEPKHWAQSEAIPPAEEEEARYEREEENVVQTPVQIESAPSPENQHWRDEEQQLEEEGAAENQSIKEDREAMERMEEIGLNDGEDINGNHMEAGIEKNEEEEAADEHHYGEPQQETMPFGHESPPVVEDADINDAVRVEEEAKEAPNFEDGQKEEIIPSELEPSRENEAGEERFERVKRETSEELVENEPVRTDEDEVGRKLSGADAQLGMEEENT